MLLKYTACYLEPTHLQGTEQTPTMLEIYGMGLFRWRIPCDERRIEEITDKIRHTLFNCLCLVAQFRVSMKKLCGNGNVSDEDIEPSHLVIASQEIQTFRLTQLRRLLPPEKIACPPIDSTKSRNAPTHAKLITTPLFLSSDYPVPPSGASLDDSLEGLEKILLKTHNSTFEKAARSVADRAAQIAKFRSQLKMYILPACNGIWLQTVMLDEFGKCNYSTSKGLESFAVSVKKTTATRIYSTEIRRAAAVDYYFPDDMLDQAEK